MVDTLDLGSSALARESSSLSQSTIFFRDIAKVVKATVFEIVITGSNPVIPSKSKSTV